MPQINMIAARRAEKKRQERNTQKLIYGIVAEFGVILLVTSFMVGRLVTTHNQVADLNDQIRSLQTKVDEIQHLQDATAQLQPKVTALSTARTNTLYWYTAIQNVADSLPADTWLTTLGTSGAPAVGGSGTGPSGASLTLAGMASSQFVVGATMLKMNSYPTIDQVTLSSVSQSTYQDNPVVNFNLTVQLKAVAAPPVAGGANVQKS